MAENVPRCLPRRDAARSRNRTAPTRRGDRSICPSSGHESRDEPRSGKRHGRGNAVCAPSVAEPPCLYSISKPKRFYLAAFCPPTSSQRPRAAPLPHSLRHRRLRCRLPARIAPHQRVAHGCAEVSAGARFPSVPSPPLPFIEQNRSRAMKHEGFEIVLFGDRC